MRKTVSVLLCMMLLVIFVPQQVNANEITNEMLISQLFDRRAELVSQEKYGELASVEQQLEALGVEKMTPSEVKEKYINHGVNTGARVTVPVASNVSWFSGTSNYSYNGKTYTVQTLTAQANDKSSNLKIAGSKAIASSYKWKAGAMNALSVIGSAAAGEIPGASTVLTVYDMVKGIVSGISTTTEISAAEIVYSYAHVTTASFKYVKEQGQSDNYQSLTYISTKGVSSVGYQYPTFTYSGGSAKPNVIQGSRTIYSTPGGYDSTANAVKAYVDVYAISRAYNDQVKITGIESKTVSNIYPVCPQFPMHIY